MRKQVVRAGSQRSLGYCINRMVKHKVGALLITNDTHRPVGVLSKTDLISAYYAMLPLETAAGDLIAGAPITCYPDDMLEDAIDLMHTNGIHRIFVQGAELGTIAGTLAYLDIVGLLYKYCRTCHKSTAKARTSHGVAEPVRLIVKDVMSTAVVSSREEDGLTGVIEKLTAHKCGAVLVENEAGKASGVISKTDLVLAYKHDQPIETPSREIMHVPVMTCAAEDHLAEALQQMLILDVQRLFVCGEPSDEIIGVLSLSDSARFRSGSCRACMSGRMLVEH